LPYGQAERVFERVGQIRLPDATIWRHVEKHGKRLQMYVENKQAQVSSERVVLDELFRGEIWKIIRPPHQAGLAQYAHYFEHHQRRMLYQAFREEGRLIGSGPVESEIKQFKFRLTGPGIRWARPNAERMLIIRATVLSNQFDTLCVVA
jgi:hypothetical protein